METVELLAGRAISMYRRKAIFRRRWGRGTGAFGRICGVTIEGGHFGGVGGVTVALYETTETRAPRKIADVDMLQLHEGEWAPVFVSRIRRPRRRAP